MSREYTIHLPTPHDKQREFLDSPAKRKVIVAGRRVGKTEGVSMAAADWAMDGERVLELAPTFEQTDAFWRKVKDYFREPLADQTIYKHETQRFMELPNGGRIKAKTAWDADTARGDWASKVILDEYSLMHPSVWDEVVAPMLLDEDGDAIFTFTPQHRNHAYALYLKANSDTTGRWQAWHFTSHDNPHLSKDALAEITEDMTRDAYRQEIMAEFLEGAGQVFRGHHDLATVQPESRKDGRYYVIGVDLAKTQNYTVATVMDARVRPAAVARIERWHRIPWEEQERRILSLADRYNRATICVDSTGVGDRVAEALESAYAGVVIPYQFTPKSKRQLVEGLQVAIESGSIRLLDPKSCKEAKVMLDEMDAFEYQAGATGNIRYGPPEGGHDDSVDSLALAVYAVDQARPAAVAGTMQTTTAREQLKQAPSARSAWGGRSWRG